MQDKREVDKFITTSNPGELNIFNYQKDLRTRELCKPVMSVISATTQNIRRGKLVRTPASYSRDSGFKPWPGKFPFWLRVFVFNTFSQIAL
jgi:hypothetical protein